MNKEKSLLPASPLPPLAAQNDQIKRQKNKDKKTPCCAVCCVIAIKEKTPVYPTSPSPLAEKIAEPKKQTKTKEKAIGAQGYLEKKICKLDFVR